MFTRILVPLDGSHRAEQAISVAARMARTSGGTVILMHATPIPGGFQAEHQHPAEMDSEYIIEEGKAGTSNYLDTASRMAELLGVKTETRVEFGDVAPSILAALEPPGVDFMVMCSHGYTGFKRWTLGSIAQKIISHSSVPVLVLRDGGPSFPAQPISALVALDGSPLAEGVLVPVTQLLAALAPLARTTLHLVRVVDLPVTYGRIAVQTPFDQVREEAKREAHAYLTTVADHLTQSDGPVSALTVTTSIAVNPDVSEALVLMTEQELHSGGRFDLVAMATHGRGGLQRWMMGSVTERVLHATKLPMLVVHAPTLPFAVGVSSEPTTYVKN